jgi:hypothetical protein
MPFLKALVAITETSRDAGKATKIMFLVICFYSEYPKSLMLWEMPREAIMTMTMMTNLRCHWSVAMVLPSVKHPKPGKGNEDNPI